MSSHERISGSAFLYFITRRIWNGLSSPNFSVTVKSAGSFARQVSTPVPMSRVAMAKSPSISSFSRYVTTAQSSFSPICGPTWAVSPSMAWRPQKTRSGLNRFTAWERM